MTKFQTALAEAGGDINEAWKQYLGTVNETNKLLKEGKIDTEDTKDAGESSDEEEK